MALGPSFSVSHKQPYRNILSTQFFSLPIPVRKALPMERL